MALSGAFVLWSQKNKNQKNQTIHPIKKNDLIRLSTINLQNTL
jgi:hypothetical protein